MEGSRVLRRKVWTVRASRLVACLFILAVASACQPQPQNSQVTVENRTTQDILLVGDTLYGERRYLVVACGRVVFDPRDPGAVAPSSPTPPDAVVEPVAVPFLSDSAVFVTVVITPEKISSELGPPGSLPPCQGSPPSPAAS